MIVRQKPYPDSVMERATLLRDSLDTALVAESFPLFDATDNAKFFAMSLHATIIELTSACYELFCVGHIHAIPMVLRSAQEALVDLHCLIEDPDYAEHMAADWVGTAYALPDVMSRSDRQALQRMVKDSSQREVLKIAKEAAQKYKASGRQPLGTEQKFKRVRREVEYLGYRLLSAEVHNDVSALYIRHIERREDGSKKFMVFRKIEPWRLEMMLEMASGLLIQACVLLHSRYGSGPNRFGPLLHRHEAYLK